MKPRGEEYGCEGWDLERLCSDFFTLRPSSELLDDLSRPRVPEEPGDRDLLAFKNRFRIDFVLFLPSDQRERERVGHLFGPSADNGRAPVRQRETAPSPGPLSKFLSWRKEVPPSSSTIRRLKGVHRDAHTLSKPNFLLHKPLSIVCELASVPTSL